MNKCCILFIISCILIFACKKTERVKKSPIDEPTMISIMTEVYYLDAHFSFLNSYLKDSIVYVKFNELLRKYHISKEQFDQAKAFYKEHDTENIKLEEGIKKAVQEAGMK